MPTGSRDTLLAALRTAAPGDRLALTVGVANAEWWIGRTDDARRRLHVALAELPAQPSLDRIRLRLALALTALMAADLADARGQAGDARDDARAIGEPGLRGRGPRLRCARPDGGGRPARGRCRRSTRRPRRSSG